jgi:small subunit ribosomal protein S2
MAKDNNTEVKELLNAGVHFGHLTRKWNPNMAPYIYMERNGIHIINLYKTAAKIQEAGEALKKIASSGRKILFVATKKQAKDIVAEKAKSVNMPYITERWPGGMLTNFVTIRKAVKKMATIDRMKQDGTFMTLSKKERLQVDRLRAKLEKNLGSIGEMSRLPAALFVVDTTREHIAVAEAIKLNIPIFAMVDTNCDPRVIDYIIPSNDDASKSIDKIMTAVADAVKEGLSERKAGKESAEKAKSVNMPYITERWPGGMLTNFVTIRKAVKKMATIDRMKQDGTFMTLSKKERLQVDRLRAKLEKNLGSIGEMSRLPAALFVVDTTREHIAVAEAIKLNIPIFAMVDTNCDPRVIDYIIPSNDDASKSIDKIMTAVADAVKEGLSERKAGKESAEKAKAEKQAAAETKETEEAAPVKEAAPAKKAVKKEVKEEEATKEEE